MKRPSKVPVYVAMGLAAIGYFSMIGAAIHKGDLWLALFTALLGLLFLVPAKIWRDHLKRQKQWEENILALRERAVREGRAG